MMPIFKHLKNREILILTNAPEGWTAEETQVSLDSLNLLQSDISKAGFHSTLIYVKSSLEIINKLSQYDPNEVVVFNWVEEIDHLKYGYHVAPQILDDMGFAYTGNDSKNLLLSGSKIKTKQRLLRHHVSTPKFIILRPNSVRLNGWCTYPCIIKPANEHCSYGISRESVIDNRQQLIKRAHELFAEYHQNLVVEEFIDGVEFFVSVWGYQHCQILPPVCIDFSKVADHHQKIYSYDAKWRTDSSEFQQCTRRYPQEVDITIPSDLQKEVSSAIHAVGGKGYSRVDVRIRNGISYVIDINPNPDIVSDSDFSLAAKKAGYNYGETILMLCDLAVQYFQKRTKRKVKQSPASYKVTMPIFSN